MIKYMIFHNRWVLIAKNLVTFSCTVHCIFEYVGEIATCTGPSMEPTIHAEDFLIIRSVRLLKMDSIRRGDVIVARSPYQPGKNICKRVIALPGDRIPHKKFYSELVPAGHVWLEGDNSVNSQDSRSYGPVPQGLIIGKAVCRILPFSRRTFNLTYENKFR